SVLHHMPKLVRGHVLHGSLVGPGAEAGSSLATITCVGLLGAVLTTRTGVVAQAGFPTFRRGRRSRTAREEGRPNAEPCAARHRVGHGVSLEVERSSLGSVSHRNGKDTRRQRRFQLP